MPLPTCCVLLATYQGEAHLAPQLQSLAAQRGVEWSLLWRDDGSTDGTIPILEAFAAEHPGRVARLAGAGPLGAGRLGAGGSFMCLLEAAPEADSYAFMDQDDVWLPEKLARAIAVLGSVDLVCTRLQLVTPDLTPLALSPVPAQPPVFASLLAHNVAAGCTMAMTPRGRAWALAAPMPTGDLHDWWCALAITGCGGRLHFDPIPSLLYRQHGRNLVGGGVSMADRARRMLGRGGARFHAALAGHMAALPALPLSAGSRAVLSALAGLREASPRARLRAMRRAGLAHHAPLGQWLLRFWVLTRRMP